MLCTHRGRRRRRLDRSGFPSGPVPGQAICIFRAHEGRGDKNVFYKCHIIYLLYNIYSGWYIRYSRNARRWLPRSGEFWPAWKCDGNDRMTIILYYFPRDASKSDTSRPQRNTLSVEKIADVYIIWSLIWLVRLFDVKCCRHRFGSKIVFVKQCFNF